MKIIVCVKQVPDTSGKVAVKADGTMDRAAMATITNHDDLAAVEAALRIKDATGCKVVVVSMGPPPAEGMLRELLAMGADESSVEYRVVVSSVAGDMSPNVYDLILVKEESDLRLDYVTINDRNAAQVKQEGGSPATLNLTVGDNGELLLIADGSLEAVLGDSTLISGGEITAQGGSAAITRNQVTVRPAAGQRIVVFSGESEAAATEIEGSPFASEMVINDLLASVNKYFHSYVAGDTPPEPEEFTITFDASGGATPAPQTTVKGRLTSLPVSTRYGYDFLGWELNDETYAAGEKYTVTSSVTFTAQWKETDGDGGNGDEEWENPYADVTANQWFYAAVQYVSENKLMNGVAENAFGPDTHTTRGMLVTILHRMEGEPQAGEHSFADVAEDKYYADAVAWAAENDIVNGYSDTVFAPEKAMSREEMAVVLYRYAQYKGWDVSAQGDLSRYADSESVSAWSAEAMTWAVGAKVMDGMDGRLAPQGDALRSQTATVLMRVSTLAGN